MNANNRLEMFLTLNAEAFKRSLGAVDAGVRHMAGGVSTAMAATKAKFQEGLSAVSNYNAGLREQHGITQLLTGSVTRLIAPLAGLFSIMAGGRKVVEVTREFDKLSAGLITATGSAEGSKEAFAAIQDFATKTPYDLAQVTDSFVKLVNFGLNPSERAMTSYGNTSSALGKELNQMIEAVADAATGEFERLKEFGIKASKEGDKVKFTFRGVATEVGNNAKEIENYLIQLGETNFGDAMANRMSTLDGALSNLGDEWDKLFLNISQTGIGDAIADAVGIGISALEELNAMVASGELLGYLQAYAGQWAGWADDVKKSLDLFGNDFDAEMDHVQGRGSGVVSFLTDSFRQFPENVRAFIGLVTVVVASEFDKIMVQAKAFKDMVKALFNDKTIDDVAAERDRQLKIIEDARDQTIDSILKERQVALDSTNAQIEAAKKLRAEYEKNRQVAKADTSDRLEKFQVKDEKTDEEKKPQAKDFNVKSGAKFVQKDGEWVQVDDGSAKTAEAKKPQDEEYQKQLAKKRKQLTPDEFQDRQEYWQKLEDERPLTKEEEKEKKAEEVKFRKEEAERKRAENEALRQAKSIAAAQRRAAAENARREKTRLADEAKEQDRLDRDARLAIEQEEEETPDKRTITSRGPINRKAPDSPIALDASRRRQEEEMAEQLAKDEDRKQVEEQAKRDRQLAEEEKQREKERAATAEQAEKDIARANTERTEAAKKAAEEWAQAEVQATEKAKTALQKYYDKVKSLQDDIIGREKSLADELDELDNRGTAESKWRRKAKEAKDYEKAAKEAMKAGDMETALSLSDQAKAAYSSLKGGAGSISEKLGDQAAYRGVKSSGMFGIDIAKAIQAATAKTALSGMPGADLFGDLSGRIRGQLAAVAGGGPEQVKGGGGEPVAKVHELRFQGGSMRGGEADVEALLNLLSQAGMSAG